MAIKATNQITITDITDAYSVILTSEAYTFVGNVTGAASGLKCATQAVAYCGTNQCTSITIGTVTVPTGISATITDNGTAAPTVTFVTTATITAACEATIPVTVDGVTINKKFSFAVAKTGATGAQGTKGDKDAIVVSITTSNGTVFKNNSGSTVLTAHVYVGGVEQTITSEGVCGSYGTIKWYKGTSTTAVATASTLTVKASDVDNAASYTCQLEG